MTDRKDFAIDIKRYKILPIIIVLTLFVLFAPYLVRFYNANTTVIGSESYLSLRYAEELNEYKELSITELVDRYSSTPDLVYSRRTFHFNPYHVLLSFVGDALGMETAAHILPIILGILSLLLFAKILESIGYASYRRDIVLLMLITSPAFIYAFTFSTSHSLAILFSLLSIFLFTKGSKVWLALSIASMFIVSLFSIFNSVILFLVLLAYSLHHEKKRPWFFIALFFTIVFLFIKRANLYYSYTTHDPFNFISSLFSDLGGMIGFGFFAIFLVFLGWGVLWKKRKQMLVFMIPIIILLSYIYVGEGFFMYLAFFIAIAAAEGFLRLSEMEWNLPLLKVLTIILLICGVLFSTVSYTDRLIDLSPSPETLHSLELLHKSSKAGEIVLTHPNFGYWVESVADRKVLVDSLSTDNYKQDFLYKVADSIFGSRDLEETTTLLYAYKVRYIWITPEMKSGLVWNKDNEGLLFLLENSEKFKKVYSTYGYDIWEVIKPPRMYSPVEKEENDTV